MGFRISKCFWRSLSASSAYAVFCLRSYTSVRIGSSHCEVSSVDKLAILSIRSCSSYVIGSLFLTVSSKHCRCCCTSSSLFVDRVEPISNWVVAAPSGPSFPETEATSSSWFTKATFFITTTLVVVIWPKNLSRVSRNLDNPPLSVGIKSDVIPSNLDSSNLMKLPRLLYPK